MVTGDLSQGAPVAADAPNFAGALVAERERMTNPINTKSTLTHHRSADVTRETTPVDSGRYGWEALWRGEERFNREGCGSSTQDMFERGEKRPKLPTRD